MGSMSKVRVFVPPVIGQEAICPDGLGRVVAFKNEFPHQWIKISTYVNDRQCEWAPHNVELIAIGDRVNPIKEEKACRASNKCYTEAQVRQVFWMNFHEQGAIHFKDDGTVMENEDHTKKEWGFFLEDLKRIRREDHG